MLILVPQNTNIVNDTVVLQNYYSNTEVILLSRHTYCLFNFFLNIKKYVFYIVV